MPQNDDQQQDYTYKLQMGVKGDVVINAGIYKGRYSTWVEEMGEDSVGFAYPLMQGMMLPVYRDLEFEFIMEDGAALYVFEMSVKRADTRGTVPIMWARQSGYPKRIQRREFLRVPCFWDIMIFHLGYETRKPMASKWCPAKAVDVSLGGCRFKMDKSEADRLSFETNDSMLMFFTLSEKQYMLSGKGTRIVHDGNTWEVGMGFDSVPSSLEKKLFEFIRQQEMLSRDE